jgi:DNA repair ATPase RecN
MAYIYGHYKKDTGELFYVGKGSGKRAWSKSRNKHWHNVVNKHGYVVKILEDGLTDEQAFSRERELIAEVGLNNLTNMLDGGQGLTVKDAQRRLQDTEFRNRFTQAMREKVHQNPEWKQKISESVKKLHQDPEWKQKISESVKKLHQDPEWKQKNLEANRKRVQNPEYRKRLSESVKRYWEQKRLMKS